MKRITLTDEQLNLLIETIGFADGESASNDALAKLYPERAAFYRLKEQLRKELNAAIDAAEPITEDC